MEINVNVAEGYVKNSRNRRHQCELWSEWLELMAIGEPITATQLAERISRAHGGSWYFTPSWQAVSAMLNAVKNSGAVMRMEVAIEPYEIEVEIDRHWSNRQQCYVDGYIKKIIVDKKTVFVRMV